MHDLGGDLFHCTTLLCAGVLIGRIKRLARLSVCPSVRPSTS